MIDNILFYEYRITNKSNQAYDSFRVGEWANLNIGNPYDDYIGYDSARRLTITYNAKDTDGYGEASAYGAHQPISGVTLLEIPGDNANNHVPAGSYTYYNNTMSGPLRNPQGPNDYNNLLSARTSTGTAYANPGRYALYSLDEACLLNAPPNDSRTIIATPAAAFLPGQTIKIAMALVVCPNAGGCPNIDFSCIRSTADTALAVYQHPLPPTGIREEAVDNNYIRVYPNPINDVLKVQCSAKGATIELLDMMGRVVSTVTLSGGAGVTEIDTRQLAAGFYLYKITEGGSVVAHGKLVKE